MVRLKRIKFNEEMSNDIEEIRNHFQKMFKVRPSNTAIVNLLIKTFKESKPKIKRKPKTKKTFMVEF
jgi:hypothetical protein